MIEWYLGGTKRAMVCTVFLERPEKREVFEGRVLGKFSLRGRVLSIRSRRYESFVDGALNCSMSVERIVCFPKLGSSFLVFSRGF